MMDLLRTDVIEKTLDAHIGKYSNTNEAAKGFLKRLLVSNAFVVPIATFVRLIMDIARENMKYCVAFASKERMDTVDLYNDKSEIPPSHLECRSQKSSHRRSSKRLSNR